MANVKIKDAPTTTVAANQKIPVGNVGDNDAHTITPNDFKSWILSNDSGGITWNDLRGRPQFVERTQIGTINGQSILDNDNINVTATAVEWVNVLNKPTIPHNTSELNNDSGFITSTDAANTYQTKLVSGVNLANINGYDLLSGGNIVIPSPNDGTLTIKENGVTVGTFTANSATDTTIDLTGGGGGVPSYTDTTDSTATPTITIEGNQVVRCTNQNITAISFQYDPDYLNGNQRELTSTIYFTCGNGTPTFSFPNGAHIYGDFYNLLGGTPYIISIQGDNFILTPSAIDFNTIQNVPQFIEEPVIVDLWGQDDGYGTFKVVIGQAEPNTIYRCWDCTQVNVDALSVFDNTQPTRIYMKYPQGLGAVQDMTIYLPFTMDILGENSPNDHISQNMNFAPFAIEILGGFVEKIGVNP